LAVQKHPSLRSRTARNRRSGRRILISWGTDWCRGSGRCAHKAHPWGDPRSPLSGHWRIDKFGDYKTKPAVVPPTGSPVARQTGALQVGRACLLFGQPFISTKPDAVRCWTSRSAVIRAPCSGRSRNSTMRSSDHDRDTQMARSPAPSAAREDNKSSNDSYSNAV
jgi:hypothetical protein